MGGVCRTIDEARHDILPQRPRLYRLGVRAWLLRLANLIAGQVADGTERPEHYPDFRRRIEGDHPVLSGGIARRLEHTGHIGAATFAYDLDRVAASRAEPSLH